MMCTEDLKCLTQISKRVGKIESKPCMHCEYCSLISVAFCWIQKFNLLPKYMLCWIGIVSYATVKYGCVIKYVFVYIGTMISCIYFQRVVAVLMRSCWREWGVSIIEYFKKNVEDDLKRPAVCHAASCEEDKIA